MRTPKDFDFLCEKIRERLNIMISVSTLKRLWGYVESDGEARTSTLDTIARMGGYSSWKGYLESDAEGEIVTSSPVLKGSIDALRDLVAGDRLVITWEPGRVCEVAYLGEGDFEVLKTEKTRLQPGDRFSCSLFIEDEPLYILHHGYGCTYVCGKSGGVRFTKL